MATYSIEDIKRFLIHHVTDPGLSDDALVELYCHINNKWGQVNRSGDQPIAEIFERDEKS